MKKQAVERALCFSGLPRLVEEGAAGGFEAAQVVAAREGLQGGDDALRGGQFGSGGMAEDEVV